MTLATLLLIFAFVLFVVAGCGVASRIAAVVEPSVLIVSDRG